MGILTEDMKRVVTQQRLGFVATVCADSTPNLSPKGTTTVWDDDHLVFADIHSPGTVANLRANPSIEINVVDPIVRKGYRFKGIATVLSDGPRCAEIVGFLRGRGVAADIRSVVLVRVARAEALISPAYDVPGVSEEQVCARWQQHFASLKQDR
jgi:predicted pyridoxine 5'-phosphate oxidase superfamily flavin-nucleotide-binding protein